jgi:hypothetical protein
MGTPWDILQPSDFPLIAIGASVYRVCASSPLFTAPYDHIAADLAYRLNAFEASKLGTP